MANSSPRHVTFLCSWIRLFKMVISAWLTSIKQYIRKKSKNQQETPCEWRFAQLIAPRRFLVTGRLRWNIKIDKGSHIRWSIKIFKALIGNDEIKISKNEDKKYITACIIYGQNIFKIVAFKKSYEEDFVKCKIMILLVKSFMPEYVSGWCGHELESHSQPFLLTYFEVNLSLWRSAFCFDSFSDDFTDINM